MTQIRSKASRITELMDNRTLARVEKMRIMCNRKFTNPARGEHLSGRGGSSTEFADYRDYVEGDDIRNIDWNIFSRLRRPYVKLFHQEQELHVLIIVDASASMNFDGKLERAKELAAALAVMALYANERVSLWSFRSKEEAPVRMGPLQGRPAMFRVFDFLEKLEAGEDMAVEEGVEQVMTHHRGRGIALLLSDFLTEGNLQRMFNALYGIGMQPFALQVLSPAEVDPEVNGDTRLVDVENGLQLDVTGATHLMKLYHEYRLRFFRQIDDYCKSRNGRAVSLNSGDPLEHILFQQLLKKGWVI